MQTQMINFSIPKPLLSALDEQAKNEVKTRSEAMRDAIRLYIRQRQELDSIFAFGKKKAKKLGLKQSDVERLIDEYRQGK
jgi:metal-responsive CopG/Arc/MetJ family transcriptional regulator